MTLHKKQLDKLLGAIGIIDLRGAKEEGLVKSGTKSTEHLLLVVCGVVSMLI